MLPHEPAGPDRVGQRLQDVDVHQREPPASRLPTGTVTFLFTDIEGSTQLLHELGPEQYAVALAEHRRVLRAAFTEHGGVEVDTQGDAFFVAFPTAPGAAAAALDGQERLEPGPIRVRMGVHTGTPTVTAEGYVGIDVHRGARVAALANGGQVLLTEATAQLLDAQLTDLGRHRLKDFDGPARLLQMGTTSFPSLRTPGAVSLPTPATPFLGRDRELFDGIALVLEHDPAILTIIGPGGTGKTRFALELARLLAEDADGGTLFVPFAALRDPALMLSTLAEVLGADGAEPGAIAARVGEKRTHVVLDNLEQLLPEVAAPLASLVDASPSLRLLVASREALGVAAETRFDLPPLTSDDAVELFLARARAVRPDIAPTVAVRSLCDRLDRLPLALELAAARTRLLSPEQLLERLSARLDLPAPRDADPRHATLRSTIAWSYELLAAEERDLFIRLAVFRGGCSLEAIEDVCAAELETVASLIDKSLLRRRTDPQDVERYWMLETIREFAAVELRATPELEREVRQRHATWTLALARSAALAVVDRERGRQAHYHVAIAAREEFRGAIAWATEHEPVLAAELVIALENYWATTAPNEGRSYAEALLCQGDVLPAWARAPLLRWAGAAALRDDLELGEQRYRMAIELFEALGDRSSVVGLQARFAVHAGLFGEVDEARRLVAEVRAANGAVGNLVVEPQMLSTLAKLAHREGDVEAALAYTRESIDVAAQTGFDLWALWELPFELELAFELGRPEEAARAGRRGLRLAQRLDDRRVMLWLLVGLALAALRQGAPEHAGELWGGFLAAQEEEPASVSDHVVELARPVRECRAAAFLAAVEEGRLLPLPHVVELALDESQTVP